MDIIRHYSLPNSTVLKVCYISIFFVIVLYIALSWQSHYLALTLQSAWAVEYRGVRPPLNKCPGYDIKPSDGKAPALEIWGM